MINQIKKDLKELLNEKRYLHSIRVSETAENLAKIYDEDLLKVNIAALLHDYAKCFDKKDLRNIIKEEDIVIDEVIEENIGLSHGLIGALYAKKHYHIFDNDILNAIEYHTYGRPNMSLLEKIIYISDYIEPDRDFEGIDEIRYAAQNDLDKGVLMALNSSINYVKSRKKTVHPLSIKAVEYYSKEVFK